MISAADAWPAMTSNPGVAVSPIAVATNGTQTPFTEIARIRWDPSHRSIRSSPERRNSSSEPAMSSGAARSTRNGRSALTATQRSVPQCAPQLVKAQADPTLHRPQRQTGLAGDLLVRLAADVRAPDQVRLRRRERVDEL